MRTPVPFESNLPCRKCSVTNTAQHHFLVVRHFVERVLALTSLVNLLSLIFSLTPAGLLIGIYFLLSYVNILFCLRPLFQGSKWSVKQGLGVYEKAFAELRKLNTRG